MGEGKACKKEKKGTPARDHVLDRTWLPLTEETAELLGGGRKLSRSGRALKEKRTSAEKGEKKRPGSGGATRSGSFVDSQTPKKWNN